MKFVFVFLVALAVAYAAPGSVDPKTAQIVRSDFNQEPEGSYTYNFDTDNSIHRDEVGELKLVKDEDGKDDHVVVMRGSYSYLDVDGKTYTVNYYADETGFHAEGEHIPKAP